MSSGVRQGSRPRRSTRWTGKELSLAPSSSSGLSILSTSVILFANHINIKVFFSTEGTLEKNLNNIWSFIKIYAVFVLNLCGEKSGWRKNDNKYEVCSSSFFT